jgi:sporulation protein YlmC with PRC-barrel domain
MEIAMRTILLASAAFLVLSQASAQGPTSPPATANQMTNSAVPPNSNQRLGPNLRNMLQKSGYTDIRVAPTSFMVHAKDSDGNAVVMSIGPDSFAEVTDMNAPNESTTGSANTTPAAGSFVTIPNSDYLSSRLVGLDIYNNDKKDIGQIKDVALNQNGRTQAYIVSVGGFLGMDEHYVAVSPSAVKVSYNATDKKWHAAMNASADQLKAAPEFKYTGRWDANRT